MQTDVLVVVALHDALLGFNQSGLEPIRDEALHKLNPDVAAADDGNFFLVCFLDHFLNEHSVIIVLAKEDIILIGVLLAKWWYNWTRSRGKNEVFIIYLVFLIVLSIGDLFLFEINVGHF